MRERMAVFAARQSDDPIDLVVEAEQCDIAILEQIVFTLKPIFASFTGFGNVAGLDQVLVGDDFGRYAYYIVAL